jgi:hypothetical protein
MASIEESEMSTMSNRSSNPSSIRPSKLKKAMSTRIFTGSWKDDGGHTQVDWTQVDFLPGFVPPTPRQEWIPDQQGGYISSLAPQAHKTHSHRAATGADLCLDLVYVVFLERLGALFREHPNRSTAVRDFVFLFWPLWLQWNETSLYLNYWETRDVVNSIFFAGNVIFMVLVGVSLSECNSSSHESCGYFTFVIAGARGWLILFLGLCYYYNPRYRKVLTVNICEQLFVVFNWIVVGSIYYPCHAGVDHFNELTPECEGSIFFFWGLALVFDTLKDFVRDWVIKYYWKKPLESESLPLNTELLVERHSLFIVLSFGEIIAACPILLTEDDLDGDSDDHRRGLLSTRRRRLSSSDLDDDDHHHDDDDDHGDDDGHGDDGDKELSHIEFYRKYYILGLMLAIVMITLKYRYFDFSERPSPSGKMRDLQPRHALKAT